MNQLKYTCVNCESNKEPYFSRSEPMGFFCRDCGQSSDQLAVIHPNAIRTQQEEQNDHECELAAWELLKEAKATAEHWIQKAKQSEQAAEDLKAELADTRRYWKEELEEQARLLGMSAERECGLRGRLERERDLADRLAEALRELCETLLADKPRDITELLNKAGDALTAWKDASSE